MKNNGLSLPRSFFAVDTFGHSKSTPWLLELLGYEYMYTGRIPAKAEINFQGTLSNLFAYTWEGFANSTIKGMRLDFYAIDDKIDYDNKLSSS